MKENYIICNTHKSGIWFINLVIERKKKEGVNIKKINNLCVVFEDGEFYRIIIANDFRGYNIQKGNVFIDWNIKGGVLLDTIYNYLMLYKENINIEIFHGCSKERNFKYGMQLYYF